MAVAVGAIGAAFHVYDVFRRPGRLSWSNLFYGAPLGAQESQIESVSLGEEKPVCTDQTEECWAKNRRDDMLYGGQF